MNNVGDRFDELRKLCSAAGDKASLAIAMAGLVVDHTFQDRVRAAYMAGPGRAIDFLLSSADLYEFAARLPYASTSIALGTIDASQLTAMRTSLDESLNDAERAQSALAAAESQLVSLRSTIERRLADAVASSASDASALAIVNEQRKQYAGTLDRVAGATRTIRRRRGEAMYAAAAPLLGRRKDCTIPKGLRSTGDRIGQCVRSAAEAVAAKPFNAPRRRPLRP